MFLKILWKSIHNFLSNPANNQPTNTNLGTNIFSLVKVNMDEKMIQCSRSGHNDMSWHNEQMLCTCYNAHMLCCYCKFLKITNCELFSGAFWLTHMLNHVRLFIRQTRTGRILLVCLCLCNAQCICLIGKALELEVNFWYENKNFS